MSHFVTVVILPKDIETSADDLLAPYSETLDVEPYEKPCYCIGYKAKKDAVAAANAKYGTLESLRASFHDKLNGRDPWGEEVEAEWQQHIAPWKAERERVFEAHPLKSAPDADCEECNGTGQYTTTRNPCAKWDWYSIGGRWNGAMIGKPRDDETGFNFGDEYRQLDENTCAVQDIAPDFVPFAVVTPDGEWHEKGEMGWFAMVSNKKPKDEWAAIFAALKEQYADHLAVSVDCHI